MYMAGVVTQGFEYDNLESKEEPRHIDEQRYEQHDDSRIKSQDVRVFHQRKARCPELLFQRLWQPVRIALLDEGIELLEFWGLPFLSSRVVAIEIEVYLVKPFLAVPGQRPHQGALLGIVVQFASRCSFEEIKVDVAVVVGHGALFGMAVETGEGGNQPNPYSPRLPPRSRFAGEAQAQEKINGEESHVAGKAVQNASD